MDEKFESLSDVIIPFSKLTYPKKIGFGTFSTVYLAQHSDWGCDVVYKKMKIDFVDPSDEANQK